MYCFIILAHIKHPKLCFIFLFFQLEVKMLVRFSRISVKKFVFFHIYVGTETFVNQIYIYIKYPFFISQLRRTARGWEARQVCGAESASRRYPVRSGRRMRCFNCGDVTRHVAAECPRPPLPKRCHYCKVRGRNKVGAYF